MYIQFNSHLLELLFYNAKSTTEHTVLDFLKSSRKTATRTRHDAGFSSHSNTNPILLFHLLSFPSTVIHGGGSTPLSKAFHPSLGGNGVSHKDTR
jgi:hypothetical protein